MMVFSACVNETVHLLYMILLKTFWFIMLLSRHLLHLVVFSALQGYETD